MTLEERRAEATARLATLQHERAATMLDTGATPSKLNADVQEAESEVAAIDDALTEVVHRERHAAAAAREKYRAEQLARLHESEAARLNGVERAEKAARELIAAFHDVLSTTDEMNKCISGLQARRPLLMEISETERRLAGRLCLLLKTVRMRSGYYFGNIALRPTINALPGDSWREFEESEGKKFLAPFQAEKEKS